MLEVKSPWNSEVLDKIPQDNENHLSKLLETSSTISQKKGLDFSPIERISVLKKFSENIKKYFRTCNSCSI